MANDTLRDQVAKAVCSIAIGSERVETVMEIIQEHTAKAELRADARARVDEIKERFRADRAEAKLAKIRALAESTDRGVGQRQTEKHLGVWPPGEWERMKSGD